MDRPLTIALISVSVHLSLCTISGLTYMDPIIQRDRRLFPGEDPCNPLYWYPRQIPEECNYKTLPKQDPPADKYVPLPLPVPIQSVAAPPLLPLPAPPRPPCPPQSPPPPPFPPPGNWPLQSPGPMLIPQTGPMIFPPPGPIPDSIPQYIPPIPFGVPIAPSNPMLPGIALPYQMHYPPNPYSEFRSRAGLVPGIEGIVSNDGGVNILPFSDAYADMLEKHKQKLIRRRLEKVFDDYDNYPKSRYVKRSRYRRRRYH